MGFKPEIFEQCAEDSYSRKGTLVGLADGLTGKS
jgi:hypothetical protein